MGDLSSMILFQWALSLVVGARFRVNVCSGDRQTVRIGSIDPEVVVHDERVSKAVMA